MKIVTIVGARPQFVKAAVISRAIKDFNNINEVIVHTGQHFDFNMSDVFFQEMEIPKPDYLLNIHSSFHGAMTGQMLEKIEEVLIKEKPDWVLVYGDTNSTLAGALAASKLHIRIAHVESGLRSFNMMMPEEINRILTDRISSVLFCPTKAAIRNLVNEGFVLTSNKLHLVGDVMYDASLFYSKKASPPNFELSKKFILATIHRAENTNNWENLKNIFLGFELISKQTQLVIPLHPRTKNILVQNGFDFNNTAITFTEPVSYLEMVYLISNCNMVVTDSGGLQKESYFFSKYCLTIRDETEWIELIEGGYNQLCSPKSDDIVNSINQIMLKEKFDKSFEYYGNGNTAEIILNILSSL